MNETIRTVIYVTVASAAALAAFATRPSLREDRANIADSGIKNGDPLFPKFTPLDAKNLTITKFDTVTGTKKTFTVAQLPSGKWVLPSHHDYPADAEQQMGAMATALTNLTVLDRASQSEEDHELFGVEDPSKAEPGAKGVGTLVTLQDAKGGDLFNLIVGKAVEGSPNLHFVRNPKETTVYVTSIDLSKLPTQFEKWIEKDLLKISTFDVNKVLIKDYVIRPTTDGNASLRNRMEAELNYDGDKGEWSLGQMRVASGQGMKPVALGEQEELNKPKLDDLRNALADVKIVDVERKPAGLGNSVRVPRNVLTPQMQSDLQKLGFFAQSAGNEYDIYAESGEVLIETKDGVQYVLRFGKIAPEVDLGIEEPAEGEKTEKDSQIKIHRYLFVTTQVAPSVLVPPQLEPEPAGPEPAPAKPEEAKTEEKSDETKTGDEEKKATPVIDPAQAARDAVKKANERKMNEFNDKKKKAEVRVKELNARFADWYYVVSEDVYKKIRLVRSDIVREKPAAKEEGYGVDAFRTLEQGGVKGDTKPASGGAASPVPGGAFPM